MPRGVLTTEVDTFLHMGINRIDDLRPRCHLGRAVLALMLCVAAGCSMNESEGSSTDTSAEALAPSTPSNDASSDHDDQWAIAANRPGYNLAFLASDGTKRRDFSELYGTVDMDASPTGERLLLKNFEQPEGDPSFDEMTAIRPDGESETVRLQDAQCVNWWDETSLLVSYDEGPPQIAGFDGTKRDLAVAEPGDGCYLRSGDSTVLATTYPGKGQGPTRITEHEVGESGTVRDVGSYDDCSALPSEMHPTKRLLALGANCDGTGTILVVDLDSGETKRLTDEEAGLDLALPSWTPSGESIIAGRVDAKVDCCDTYSIVQLDLDGSIDVLTPFGFSHPQVVAIDWLDA